MGRDTLHQLRLLRAPSRMPLNTSRDGASTASLGSLPLVPHHPLSNLHQLHIFLVLEAPDLPLDTVLQMWSHKGRTQGQSPPSPC